MANTYTNILKAGLQASYNALQTKDNNVLYFCTDTGKIYKGEVDFTNSVVVAASKPETPIVGKLYVLADTNTVEVFVGGAWKVVSYPTVTSIDVNSDDNHIATAAAVYNAIQDAIEDLSASEDTVKAIEAGSTEASIKITKGDDSSSEFTVKGVVTTPTWDATARKLTLPVSGGSAVEVNIGKDIFLDPEAENKYNAETGNIELHLNDGTTIEVPASALVDIYTGENTETAEVEVTDDNKIVVNVRLDDATGNAIVVGENGGLRVDLSAYAKTSDVNTATSALQTAVEKAQEDADKANTAIGILNGDATTEGSVAKQVVDAKTTLQGNIDGVAGRVTELEGRMNIAETNIQTNADNIAALATAATGWGSF